ncbi:MAG: DUF547 domain-containing protein [Alphaproteobacteria bacterium]|nr:DUF547 domain-containing protein [Alphaproteobacteria bacterium]
MQILKGARTAITCAFLGVSYNALAANQPTFPTGHNPASEIDLKYEDMDYLLEKTVLPLGKSDHRPAYKPDASTGTRVIKDNPKPSRLEGNRIMYHFIETDEQKMVVREVRDTLLALPDRIDLAKLNRNEQLAYWLNLHNAIVIAEVADRYPVVLLDRLYGDCEKKPKRFACERQFSVMGQKISLTDIRQHVLSNWNDPVVIYGFFMGAVGTPDIRTKAFTGDSVYADLEDNAVAFVNSVRGTRMSGDRRVRVSEYYKIVAQKFPVFERDILEHLKKYARGDFRRQLDWVEEVDPVINDWYIADLFNGNVTGPDGANFISDRGNGLSSGKYPPHVHRLLQGVTERHKRRRGIVDIETVEHGTSEEMDDEIAVAPQTPEEAPEGN